MSALIYTTTCTLCKQKFHAPSLKALISGNGGTPIIGEKPVEQVQKIMERLSNHIQMKHPHEFAATIAPGMQLSGWLRMMQYATEDEYAVQMREHMRWSLLQLVQRNHIPDEKIREKVKEANFPELLQPRVVALLCEMRDIIEESGRFQVKPPDAIPTPQPASG